MKSYNAVGFAILAGCAASFALLAPATWGPWWGMAAGILYILFVWFLAGLYLSDVIHMGVTH